MRSSTLCRFMEHENEIDLGVMGRFLVALALARNPRTLVAEDGARLAEVCSFVPSVDDVAGR
ncbi:MAG: hypothetical protein EA397_15470 [Deltaproteobacteria bacterium]|nr:MAG: hypothetical protein EA397_15470 [Deltaproteobacteria bacterium]